MGCYMVIQGDIKPREGTTEKVQNILREYRVEIGLIPPEPGVLSVSFADEGGWSMASDLVNDLTPFLTSGYLYTRNDDTDHFACYTFKDGKSAESEGTPYVYYAGAEEDFVRQLPHEVIQAVLKKYGK